MKEKINVLTYKYKLSIFVFLFVFLILTISPLSGDVIKEYEIGKEGIFSFFQNSNYFFVEKIKMAIIAFFTHNRLIFNTIFAGLISLFVYNVNSLVINIRNKHFYLFTVIQLLLLGSFTFSLNYMSIKGAFLFTIPSILIFLYFINVENLNNKNILLYLLVSLIIININNSLGIYFFITNILYFYVFNRKINNNKQIILIAQLINLILLGIFSDIPIKMFVSEIPLLKDNASLFIKNLFSSNILLFVIGAVPINYYLKDNLKNNMYRRVKIFVFNIPLIFSLLYNFGNYFPVNTDLVLNRYSGVFAVENYYYITYFIIYIYLFIVSTNFFVKERNLQSKMNIFHIISILLMLQSILTENFNVGLYVFIIFSLMFGTFISFTEIKIKIYPRTIIAILSLLMIYYLSIFATIKIIENKRVKYINEQINKRSEKIEIMANPFRILFQVNFVGEDELIIKKHYNILKDKEIEIKYIGIFRKIEKKVR